MNEIVKFGSSPALDNLQVPDGRRVRDLPHGELYSILGRLGVSGFGHHKGRTDNVAAYASHLEAIGSAAATAAIAAWMVQHRSA